MSTLLSNEASAGGLLDVIVRFHAVARLPELERCLLSLIGQSTRPLAVHIVTQRFTETATATVQTLLDNLARIDPGVPIALLNYDNPEPADARSSLINLGFAAIRGRYVALLDYDDVTAAHGYARLINDLKSTGAAISFGKVLAARLVVDGPIIMSRARDDIYSGTGVVAMFRQNFCPIHSFVIDRTRIDPALLHFDPERRVDEDYDFLICLCAAYPSSFAQKEYVVGYYGLKDDGSNTVMTPGQETEARWALWRSSADKIAALRARTPVSLPVQRQLGRTPDPDLTVARLVEETYP